MRDTENIRYEPDEKSPLVVTLNVACQGSVLALSNTVTITTIFAVASEGRASYLAWAVFVSLVIGGIATAHMALRLGRMGPGYMLLIGPGSRSFPSASWPWRRGGCP